MAALYVKLFPALIRNLFDRRNAVGCTAVWGAARSRKAFCSLVESECPMLDHVLMQLLSWLLLRCALYVN